MKVRASGKKPVGRIWHLDTLRPFSCCRVLGIKSNTPPAFFDCGALGHQTLESLSAAAAFCNGSAPCRLKTLERLESMYQTIYP